MGGGGGFLGDVFSAVGDIVSVATLGLIDNPFKVKSPDAPSSPSNMTSETGAVVGQGEGKTFDISEQDKQRGAVTKKRLGTKQLQIPLANQSAAAGINIGATTGSTGVNV